MKENKFTNQGQEYLNSSEDNICMMCQNLISPKKRECKAFKNIPEQIWDQEFIHTEKFQGQPNDIVFEKRDKKEKTENDNSMKINLGRKIRRIFKLNTTFKEEEHPRDESGKFTEGGKRGVPALGKEEAIRKMEDRIEELRQTYGWVGVRSSGDSAEDESTRSTDWRDEEERELPGLSATDTDDEQWKESHILHEKAGDLSTPQYKQEYKYIIAGEEGEEGEDYGEVIIFPMHVELIGRVG